MMLHGCRVQFFFLFLEESNLDGPSPLDLNDELCSARFRLIGSAVLFLHGRPLVLQDQEATLLKIEPGFFLTSA